MTANGSAKAGIYHLSLMDRRFNLGATDRCCRFAPWIAVWARSYKHLAPWSENQFHCCTCKLVLSISNEHMENLPAFLGKCLLISESGRGIHQRR